jgi:hypothetical protein
VQADIRGKKRAVQQQSSGITIKTLSRQRLASRSQVDIDSETVTSPNNDKNYHTV